MIASASIMVHHRRPSLLIVFAAHRLLVTATLAMLHVTFIRDIFFIIINVFFVVVVGVLVVLVLVVVVDVLVRLRLI